MTKEEFIKSATKLGYCTKRQAEEYCEGKEIFTEDDYIAVYRKAECEEYRYRGIGLGNGGYTTKHYLRDGGSEGNR